MYQSLHLRMRAVLFLFGLLITTLLLVGCNAKTYNISDKIDHNQYTDSQLEFIQDEIGRTEVDKQVVLFKDFDELGRWFYVFSWNNDKTLSYIRYFFAHDTNEYDEKVSEVNEKPIELSSYTFYDDAMVLKQDQSSMEDIRMMAQELPTGDWQALYDYLTTTNIWSDYIVID